MLPITLSESKQAIPRIITLSAQLGTLREPQFQGHPDFMHRSMVHLRADVLAASFFYPITHNGP